MNSIKTFFLGNREPAHTEKLKNQIALIARVLVGGYLVYLAQGLRDAVKNAKSQGEMILFIAALVIFAVAGAILLYDGLRDYIIGRYAGGRLDLGPEEEEVVIPNSEEKE